MQIVILVYSVAYLVCNPICLGANLLNGLCVMTPIQVVCAHSVIMQQNLALPLFSTLGFVHSHLKTSLMLEKAPPGFNYETWKMGWVQMLAASLYVIFQFSFNKSAISNLLIKNALTYLLMCKIIGCARWHVR